MWCNLPSKSQDFQRYKKNRYPIIPAHCKNKIQNVLGTNSAIFEKVLFKFR